ncbi:MAG: L-histidine N(alpha)-methyltransferase [Bryobacteraceae bacterium]
MTAAVQPRLSRFAIDVAEGLLRPAQKKIPPRYFYDALGSSLFEAITWLPEYGLTRTDTGLLKQYAGKIAGAANAASIAELGSGNGAKARYVLEALARTRHRPSYYPVDVSETALAACKYLLFQVADVRPVCADWIDGLKFVAARRRPSEALLVLFLGSSIGNLDRGEIPDFLRRIRSLLRAGDTLLLGADLVKDVDVMLSAYDDPAGVTAAFNLNLLGRINRELDADFDLRSFAHEVRWNASERRIEMHLLSCRNQNVYVQALEAEIGFSAGETIWTESSHKFTAGELDGFARDAGFTPFQMWIDQEWPFAEALWMVE